MNNCLSGLNGERLDPVGGHYQLGNGYRAYSPPLMRFTSPDSISPFGDGGINSYTYCDGDPMNNADPSGHLSWQAWLGTGMGIVGIGLALFTAGASIAAAGGVMAAIESASVVSVTIGAAGVVSDVTAIASGTTAESNPRASSILCWVSLGAGAIGMVYEIYRAGTAGVRGLKKLGNFVGNWQYRLQHAGPCLSTSRRASLDVDSSTQVQQLLQLYTEKRLFSPRESVAAEYQEIASLDNIYKLEFHPQYSDRYTATNLAETKGIYPDGEFSFVIRADRKDDVLIGRTPDIPGRHPGPSEIAGHTSMTRDTPDSDPVDVYYAGEAIFRRGNLIRWNNTSGHYKPLASWAGRNLEPGVKKLLPMLKFSEGFF